MSHFFMDKWLTLQLIFCGKGEQQLSFIELIMHIQPPSVALHSIKLTLFHKDNPLSINGLLLWRNPQYVYIKATENNKTLKTIKGSLSMKCTCVQVSVYIWKLVKSKLWVLHLHHTNKLTVFISSKAIYLSHCTSNSHIKSLKFAILSLNYFVPWEFVCLELVVV